MIDENDLTVLDVARILRVSPERVRQLVRAATLPAKQVGKMGQFIVRREDAEALAKQRNLESG